MNRHKKPFFSAVPWKAQPNEHKTEKLKLRLLHENGACVKQVNPVWRLWKKRYMYLLSHFSLADRHRGFSPIPPQFAYTFSRYSNSTWLLYGVPARGWGVCETKFYTLFLPQQFLQSNRMIIRNSHLRMAHHMLQFENGQDALQNVPESIRITSGKNRKFLKVKSFSQSHPAAHGSV